MEQSLCLLLVYGLASCPPWLSGMCVPLIPSGSSNILAVEVDLEIFSTVILSVQLIQEGQLSVSGKRMCTSSGLLLRGLHLSRKKCG